MDYDCGDCHHVFVCKYAGSDINVWECPHFWPTIYNSNACLNQRRMNNNEQT